MNTSAPNSASPRTKTVHRIVKIRRDYYTGAANETIEDHALRFTPGAFRTWSILRVASTAFGAIAFLVLEAIGGMLSVHYVLNGQSRRVIRRPRNSILGYAQLPHRTQDQSFELEALARLFEQGASHATNN